MIIVRLVSELVDQRKSFASSMAAYEMVNTKSYRFKPLGKGQYVPSLILSDANANQKNPLWDCGMKPDNTLGMCASRITTSSLDRTTKGPSFLVEFSAQCNLLDKHVVSAYPPAFCMIKKCNCSNSPINLAETQPMHPHGNSRRSTADKPPEPHRKFMHCPGIR
jgi:hypothetical protein